MKKLLLLIVAVLLIASFVLAVRTEQNTFRLAILPADGTARILTNTPITNVSAVGFVCGSANCATINGTLWNGSVLNSGTSNTLTLEYPEILQSSFGYGIIFFKEGYVPEEITANYFGNGTAPSAIDYLARAEACTAPISNISVSQAGNVVTVVARIDSPLENNGPVGYIPPALAQHYSTNVSVMINVSTHNMTNYTATQTLLIPFSSEQNASFSFTALPGNYTVSVRSQAQDVKCLSSVATVQSMNFGVTNATNPGNNTNMTSPISLIVHSPQPIAYNTSSVLFNITAQNATSVTYSLDGGAPQAYTGPSFLIVTNGTHTLNVHATNTFGNTAHASVVFTVTQSNSTDTTPPAPVSNLTLTGRSSSTLSWRWDNPSDNDFAGTIIYINGNNVFNGSASARSYTASGLAANTTYTITVQTRDLSGNVNPMNVSSTGTTLEQSTSSGGSGGSSGGNRGSRVSRLNLTQEGDQELFEAQLGGRAVYGTTEVLSNDKKPAQMNFVPLAIVLGLLCVLLVVFIVLLLAVSGRE